MPKLDSILKGTENLEKIPKKAPKAVHFIKEEDKNQEPKIEEKIIENKNNQPNSLLSDLIEDKSNKQPLLSDVLDGNKTGDNIEDKKEEKSKKKEMQKYKTDSVLTTKKENEGKADRSSRMSKRLMRAKEQAKKKEEENKYKKSESIKLRASLLENKLSSSSLGKSEPTEPIEDEEK